jgi:hypothetical protein
MYAVIVGAGGLATPISITLQQFLPVETVSQSSVTPSRPGLQFRQVVVEVEQSTATSTQARRGQLLDGSGGGAASHAVQAHGANGRRMA